MSTWNYRLVALPPSDGGGDVYYEVREVFYDDNGVATGMTSEGPTFGGETEAEAISALEKALKDAKERRVFEPPPAWLK